MDTYPITKDIEIQTFVMFKHLTESGNESSLTLDDENPNGNDLYTILPLDTMADKVWTYNGICILTNVLKLPSVTLKFPRKSFYMNRLDR